MATETTTETRVRLSYKISAKGNFQPDITSEAPTPVGQAMANLRTSKAEMSKFAADNGYKEGSE